MMNQVRAQTRVTVKVAPQASAGLKLLARMLTLNAEELHALVQQELEENPALELADEEIIRITAPAPAAPLWEPDPTVDDSDSEDWLESRVAAPPIDLKAHVWGQLRLMAPPELLPIAEHLVESLDERGYLSTDVEEVALYLNAPLEAVEQALALLQQCDPPGVGARSLQECLLLQVNALCARPNGESDTELLCAARAVLQTGWHDFSRGRWHALQRKLKLSPEMLEAVVRFIREQLQPYPAEAFAPVELPYEQLPAQEPDIIVRASQNGLHIEIRGISPDALRLNAAYLEQAALHSHLSRRHTPEEREHIHHYLSRARIFLQALQQRYATLKRIMQVIAQRQYGFLMTGDARFLQPMTRVEVAQAAGLHRSTVGRAVRNKWLQLPSGMMVRLDVFFDASYRTAMLIQQILERYEQTGKRLSDAEIAEKLAEMGIIVARRTVAKYRQRHNILSSHWRERQRLVG